ncbi:zinc-binding alcohol dehydrogenase family protein [Neokomagataea thailandica]|uniref:Zinc-type alcohol dehydrogenase-like protein n=1 Tax=Neokomagataea tanensis NBRC 106556 TaxID=1223519 RepID=A0ABQ0QHX8_9PROT|nr:MULTISPECIES: zinc-binding alcohol dehydrogenase family protein [Neokomagataea]GBR45462.1 zinc-dependent alcohol dehydrogenase [Neokomagataea tanensis NBRC 106556]
MKAFGHLRATNLADSDALVELSVPTPEPGLHDVIVEISAVSVNPVDTKLRQINPPEERARILGYDACGTIVATGGNVYNFRSGDRVFYAGSASRAGSNAQYQAVDERLIAHAPKTLDDYQAAAMPLTAITAWELLFDRLRVPNGSIFSGDSLLIIGGAGGVGSILIQLARRLTGLRVIATASRPETYKWCEEMGAHHIINHTRPLDQELKRIGIPEVRYVASLTHTAKHKDAILKILSPQGSLALIDDPGSFDIMPFKRKSLSVHWEFMFTRPLFDTPDMAAQGHILSQITSLVETGLLRSTCHTNLGPITLPNLLTAHQAQESGMTIGKTVLTGF